MTGRAGAQLGPDRPAPPSGVTPVVSPPTPPSARGAAGGGAPPIPGGIPAASSAVRGIILPPHFFPPPTGSTAIYPFGSATQAGPNAAWTVPAGCVLNVPPAYSCVVRSMGIAYLNSLATTNITLQLRVNGAVQTPVRQLPAIPLAYISDSWDDFAYLISGPAKVDLLATVVDGGTYTITAWASGWLITQDAWSEFFGQ